VLKTHVQFGYEILNKISFPFNLAEIVWCHHEYLDGSGYPRGIGGDALPLEARILTVADIVESMSADRPYRKSLGMAVALEEIQRQSGSRLDPVVVDACLHVVQQHNWRPVTN
jgi:HD-GYP domain-containing protein (c-di-GMP phosphodiesterase class II)